MSESKITRDMDTDRIRQFLSRPESYPELTSRVDLISTHMSWFF
ncbi:MAG: hypothetical protein R3281_00255 [Balneolaceae bacterium]|nr:hypothetical protein [Balneolaceae bacterium]